MNSIQKLPSKLISQIAAGEIIERPTYVVKELIDNALDAQANEITIDLDNGGIDRILVQDNGFGIHSEEIMLAVQNHTTSKIKPSSDLRSINHLGFRGEALYAIASVSYLTLASRQKDQLHGQELHIIFGTTTKHTKRGLPHGTTAEVTRLFEQMPARKQYITSATKEFRLITNLITTYALAHPNVLFRLLHNNRLVLHLEPQSIESRIQQLLFPDKHDILLPISIEEDYLSIQGFLGTPQISRKMSQSFITVNRRPIRHGTISKTLQRAYKHVIDSSYKPFYFLNIHIPSERIDVNIHPRKETIQFANESFIERCLEATARKKLSEYDLTYSISTDNHSFIRDDASTKSPVGSLLKTSLRSQKKEELRIKQALLISDVYIAADTADGLLLVDQHAAEERIHFEVLQELYEQEVEKKQQLVLLDELISLSESELSIVQELEPMLRTIGFSFEYVEYKGITLRHAPFVFKGRDYKKFIYELIDDYKNEAITHSFDQQTEDMLAYLACKHSLKSGDIRDEAWMMELITKLFSCKNPYTCPHGRPTVVSITQKDLEKMFGRR